MLIYARVGLILTPTTPPLPTTVTYSPSCAIFHSCSSAGQILRFSIIRAEFPIRLLRRILQTRDREIPRREITCRKSAVFRSKQINRRRVFYSRTIEKECVKISVESYWKLWPTRFEKRSYIRYPMCGESNSSVGKLFEILGYPFLKYSGIYNSIYTYY